MSDPNLDTLTVTNHNVGKFRKGFAGESVSAVSNNPLYKLDVIAKAGSQGFTNFLQGSTVNNSGQVAFSGQTSGGYGYYLSNTTNIPTTIVPPSANLLFFGSMQLTENAKAITTHFNYSSPRVEIAVRDITGGGPLVATDGPKLLNRFDTVYSFATVNLSDQPVFSAMRQSQLHLVSGYHGSHIFLKTYSLGVAPPLRPMVADNGVVVVREEQNGVLQRIVLFNYGQAGIVQTIADESQFNSLGLSPGISDDGSIVVFQGDLKPTSANYNSVYQTTSGPGIFASIDLGGGTRKVVRIAGKRSEKPFLQNRDGICDINEAVNTCEEDELGYTQTASPIKFATYDTATRVGGVRQQLGADGLLDDVFTVSFAATPSAASPSALFSNQTGLWTVKTRIKAATAPMTGFTYAVEKPKPVIQVNDTIDGSTVQQIAFYDPISNATKDDAGNPRTAKPGDHRVAFWVQTNNGPMIVRGTYFDTDEDGLPDHWEQNGVTVGNQFINLPAMGANWRHKDLFVQANWLAPNAGIVFEPQSSALQRVIDAFKIAPVNNPDNVNGINIHIDAGPNSIMNPQTSAKWNALSRAGSFSYIPSVGVLYSSGEYDWSAFDSYKGVVPNGQTQQYYQTGRSAIFRLAFFVDTFANEPSGGDSRSIPGTDFIISLGRLAPPQLRYGIAQAGTFMHELGHTLGLRHGGADKVNYKPNYISVMNYSFQYGGLIKTDNSAELDYSRVALDELDEMNLNEAVGIGDPNHRTVWFKPRSSPTPQASDCVPQKSLTTNIDWNVNLIDNQTGVMVDLNGDEPGHCRPTAPNPAVSLLIGHNDWPVINYSANGALAGSGAGASMNPSVDVDAELTIDQIIAGTLPELLIRQGCEPQDDVDLTISGQAPVTVNFDASASIAPCGNIVSYAWDFGDGTNATGAQTSHIYSTPGTYSASVFLTDSNGNTTLIPSRYQIYVPIVITGTVAYGNAIGNPNPRYVSNALITGAGSPTVTTTTAAPGATAGQYVLTGFGSGSYTVTPTKTGGVNNITSFDAAKVSQHASGGAQLTGNQLVAADVSGNGAVTSFDSGMIAKFVTGPPYDPPGIGLTATWKFFTVPNVPLPIGNTPTSRTYPSVTSNIIGDDYTGLLLGEVSGNWSNTGARPADSWQSSAGFGMSEIVVNLPEVSAKKREVIVPVSVQGVANKGVIAYEFDLRYDPSVIQPLENPVDVARTVSRGLSVVVNPYEPGLLRVVVYGAMPISEDGVLLNLSFRAVGQAGSFSGLVFERIMFNEGHSPVSLTDGHVELF